MEIEVDKKNLREQIPYPDPTFPFYVWLDVYKLFLRRTVNAHWHYDFEFSCVVSGFVDYYVNDAHARLWPGDCVFVNSNVLHMSSAAPNCDDAVMVTVTFPSNLLSSNLGGTIHTKYFSPLMDTGLDGFWLLGNSPRKTQMSEVLLDLFLSGWFLYPPPPRTKSPTYRSLCLRFIEQNLQKFKTASGAPLFPDGKMPSNSAMLSAKDAASPFHFGHELLCMKRAIELLLTTLAVVEENKTNLLRGFGSMGAALRAKEILTYIHAHYREKLTANDLTKHLGISRSEAFRCFKRFANKAPFEYLGEYRLLKATNLIRETELSITDIATSCGFESASYFAKVFKEKYAMTPLQYRKQK